MTAQAAEALRSTESAQNGGGSLSTGPAVKIAQAQSRVNRTYTSPRHSDEEFKGFARRMIRAYGRRAADADPWVLGDLVAIQAEMDEVILKVISALRGNGYTWGEIGEELGLTKQACFNRYSGKI
jgi:hypothetical protein